MTTTSTTPAAIVATRKTFDGIAVCLWSDGLLTGRMGERIYGGKLPTSCMWRAIDEVCMYSWAELSAFVRTVKAAGQVPHKPRPSVAQTEAILASQVRTMGFNHLGQLVRW